MPAPLGNNNAKSVWFKPVDSNERTVPIQGRIIESQFEIIKEVMAERGVTKAEIVREAISQWIERQGKRAVI